MNEKGDSNSTAPARSGERLALLLEDEQTAQAVARLLERIGGIERAVDLLDSAIEQAPRLLALAVDAIDEECRDSLGREPQRIGLLGLVKSLRDPDVQRALGMALGLARRIGRSTGRWSA